MAGIGITVPELLMLFSTCLVQGPKVLLVQDGQARVLPPPRLFTLLGKSPRSSDRPSTNSVTRSTL